MMESKISNPIPEKKIENQFEKLCKVISFKEQYPHSCNDTKWIIVTTLSEEELLDKYKENLRELTPYQVIGEYYTSVIKKYNRNEENYRKFLVHHGVQYSWYQEEIERLYPNFWDEDVSNAFEQKEQSREIKELLMELSPSQRKRIYKYFFQGMTFREIADEEDVCVNAITCSFRIAKETLKKILLDYVSSINE